MPHNDLYLICFSEQWFTKLDLQSVYHLDRSDRGMNGRQLLKCFLVTMPFGLTNAPGVLQDLINDVLSDILDKYVLV